MTDKELLAIVKNLDERIKQNQQLIKDLVECYHELVGSLPDVAKKDCCGRCIEDKGEDKPCE
jgi:hypothetical protein